MDETSSRVLYYQLNRPPANDYTPPPVLRVQEDVSSNDSSFDSGSSVKDVSPPVNDCSSTEDESPGNNNPSSMDETRVGDDAPSSLDSSILRRPFWPPYETDHWTPEGSTPWLYTLVSPAVDSPRLFLDDLCAMAIMGNDDL